MPLASTKFVPGFDKQSTSYGAEGNGPMGRMYAFVMDNQKKLVVGLNYITQQ